MFVFALYPVLVWYAAFRWRRQWPAFAIIAGVSGLLLIYLLRSLAAEPGRSTFPELTAFKLILVPYVSVIGCAGLFVAVLPRPVACAAQAWCGRCGYDMDGLSHAAGSRCPECGAAGEVRLASPRPPG